MWKSDELEQVLCDACGNASHRELFIRPDGMKAVECDRCGLAFLNPRPRAEHISKLYEKDYYQKSGGNADIGYADYEGAKFRALMERHAAARFGLLEQLWQAKGKRTLEIGCATGEFCAELNRHGAVPVGIDISRHAIEMARQRHPGIDFRAAQVDEMGAAEKFDAVFGFELIEHVLSPSAFFLRARTLLQPRGILVLSTPNLDCGRKAGFQRWIGSNQSFEHLFFFDVRTLRKLAQPAGFELVEYFTGCGSGTPPVPQPAWRCCVGRLLKAVGLLERVRAARRSGKPTTPSPVQYVRQGEQHNLIVVFQAASQD